MNKNIYCDGEIINKAGADRIVIYKVILKSINEDVFRIARKNCEIRYDDTLVEGKRFYRTKNSVNFNFLRIDDDQLGTITFGVKKLPYGIFQFSPKNKWDGVNLVNFSANDVHAFIVDAAEKLKNKYGLEVDFENAEIREIELNTTYPLEYNFADYRRVIDIMTLIPPYLKKDACYGGNDKKNEVKLIEGKSTGNKQLSLIIYNKTKEIKAALGSLDDIVIRNEDGAVVNQELMRAEFKLMTAECVEKKFHGKTLLRELDDTLIKQVFEELAIFYIFKPFERWDIKNKEKLKKMIDKLLSHKNCGQQWKMELLELLRNEEQMNGYPVLLDAEELYFVLREFPDAGGHVSRRTSGFQFRENDVFLQNDGIKYLEILGNILVAMDYH